VQYSKNPDLIKSVNQSVMNHPVISSRLNTENQKPADTRHAKLSHEALHRHIGRYEVLSNLSKDKIYRGEKLTGSVAALPLRRKLFELNQQDAM